MKNQLIEEINKFKKLSGILINENSGEKALADILISRLVKTGEKALPKEIGTFTTKAGTKGVLNAEGYKNLLTKGVLNSEEKQVLHTVNKNIVREMGVDIFVTAIRDVTKGLGRLESIALENKIVNEFFDEATGNTIKSSLNIGKLKPENEPTGPQSGTPVIKVNTAPPAGIDEILSIQQTSQIRKEMSDFVSGNLDYATINQVSKEDLSKMSQIQKLRENESGLKVLEEKAKAETALIEADKKLKELALKEKELDIKLKQDKGNVELLNQKQDLKLKKAQTMKVRLGILWELKWWIVGAAVLLFGYKAFWPSVKKVLFGESVLKGVGGSSSGGSGKKSMSDY